MSAQRLVPCVAATHSLTLASQAQPRCGFKFAHVRVTGSSYPAIKRLLAISDCSVVGGPTTYLMLPVSGSTSNVRVCASHVTDGCAVVAVVKQGEIVEQGTHADLILKPNGAYATLVRLQASAQHQGLDGKQQLSEEKLQQSRDPEVLQALIASEVMQ